MTLDTSTALVLTGWAAGIIAIVTDAHGKTIAKSSSVRGTPLPTKQSIIDALWWPVTAIVVTSLILLTLARSISRSIWR